MPIHPTRGIRRCGCGFRQFLSPGEEIEFLREYEKQLQKEIAGVDARIKELEKRDS
jgi:hypothetical protein